MTANQIAPESALLDIEVKVSYPEEQDEVEAGYGSCMACKCKGYVKPDDGSSICANPACRHHWSRYY